ncbi:GNAT family N-acetyltransferase [Candidatus Roizmanbacteria bacterium]|nr:GNAT family N-acetyltransferase [Candidatus Roizmanbacteria bacterium]
MTESNKTIEVKGQNLKIVGVDFDPFTDRKYVAHGIQVAASAFGVPHITREFEHDVRNHLEGHRVLLAYDTLGIPVGFGSFDHLQDGESGILYVSGLVIRKDCQSSGIGTALSREAVLHMKASGYRVDLVAGRTQNPVVAAARASYCDPIYPITAEPVPDIISAANMLRAHLNMNGVMSPETLVTRDAYEHPLNDTRPRSKHANINTFFDMHVGPRDAVFIIGRPTC